MTKASDNSEHASSEKIGFFSTKFRWLILALVSFIAMLKAADRVALGITLPTIRSDLDISNTQAGLFATVLFVSFAVTQLPASIACRKFGARNLMLASLLVGAGAFYLIGLSTNATEMSAYRAVLGAAEAAVSVCCITIINHWFSERESGTATGYYIGGTKVGPVLLPTLIVLVLQASGWQLVFQLLAVPVLISAVIWFWLVQNSPRQSRHISPRELELIEQTAEQRPTDKAERKPANLPAWVDRLIRREKFEIIDTPGKVFQSWNLIGNTIAYMFVLGIFNVFVSWVPTYLHTEKSLGMASTGVLASILFAGTVGGNFGGGWLSDNVLGRRRKPLMMLCTLFTSAVLIGIVYLPANVPLLAATLFLMGFVFGLGYSHFTVYPMGLTTKEVYPIAFGFLNTGAALVGGLFPLLVGVLLDNYSWSVVLVALACAAAVGFAILLSIKERAPE